MSTSEFQEVLELVKLQRSELKQCLKQLHKRCEELDVCLKDNTANAYDGATTRVLWRQAVNDARNLLEYFDSRYI